MHALSQRCFSAVRIQVRMKSEQNKMHKNFNNSVELLLLVCKIFGMAPFKIENNNYRKSKLGILYNIVLIVAYTSLCGFSTYVGTIASRDDLLLRTIRILQTLSGFGLAIIVWIAAILNQNKYITALDKLNEIDKSFRELGIWMYYEKVRDTTKKYLTIKCILLLISILLESHRFLIRPEVLDIIPIIIHQVPAFLYSILSLQVNIYLKIMKERYKILNQHLRELQKYHKIDFNIIHIKNIKLTSPLGTKLSTLRIVCTLHHEICKAANVFDEIFGLSLLIAFGQSFVSVTTNLYYIISVLKDSEKNPPLTILGILGILIINVVETIWVCWICQTTIEEAENSGILLHKIDYDDTDEKNQIEMFSLQISHETLEYSAAGFFPINFTLLYSIVGGVTTYLVILMQLS